MPKRPAANAEDGGVEIMRVFLHRTEDYSTTRPANVSAVDPYLTPPHRRPKANQIKNMMKMWRQRQRLDRNPLIAVHLLANRGDSRLY